MSTKRETADFLAQSQDRAAERYNEQFRQEQMAIYKERLKKEAEKESGQGDRNGSSEPEK